MLASHYQGGMEAMVLRKNRWKARLLLAPFALAGTGIGLALAQSPAMPPKTAAPKMQLISPVGKPPAANLEPKELLRLGREAFNKGDLDTAQNYARMAAEGNASGRWGLFGDTPDALAKDIASARTKGDTSDTARLYREARELFGRPARNDSERVAYLHQASLKVDRACAAVGPNGRLPSGERPELLKREIDGALAKLNATMPAGSNGTIVTTGNPFPGPAQPKGHFGAGTATNYAGAGTGKPADTVQVPKVPAKPFELEQPAVASNPAKPAAMQLMAEGRTLLAQRKIVQAQAKFLEAQKLNVPFSTVEENPDRCLQDCALAGQAEIDRLLEKGQDHAERKETAKAELAFNMAKEIATGLGVRTREIDRELAQLAKAKTEIAQVENKAPVVIDPNMPGNVVPPVYQAKAPDVGTPPAIPPLPENPPVVPAPIQLNPPARVPDAPALVLDAPKMPEPPRFKPETPKIETPKPDVAANEGRRLIEDAETALKNGQIDFARNTAIKAMAGNYGVAKEAEELLRAVDIETLKQKKKESEDTLASVVESVKYKQYETASKVLGQINPTLLGEEQRKTYAKLVATCEAELEKLNAPAPAVAAVELPIPSAPAKPAVEVPAVPAMPEKVVVAPTLPVPEAPALIPSTPKVSERAPTEPKEVAKADEKPGELASQVKAMNNVEMQQLRDEGLRAEEAALKAFNKGETTVAMQMLSDHCTKVRASKLSVPQQNMLLGRIEQKLDTFRLMARQTEFYAKEAKEKKEFREGVLVKNAAELQKREEIAKRVQTINGYLKAGKNKEAEALALQTKQIEPDDATLSLLYELAKRNRRVAEQKEIKAEKEEMFYKEVLAVRPGQTVDMDNPVAVAIDAARRNQLRGGGDEMFIKNRTPIEREIELKLEKPLTLSFENAPLREVLGKFSNLALLNIVLDDAALADEGINVESIAITQSITQPISLRNVMQLVLEKARLQYVVENDVVRVTTMKKAKGRMHTKVFSVMDLVTPIPDFAMPEHASLSHKLQQANGGTPAWAAQQGNNTPRATSGLGGGQLTGGANAWAGGAQPSGAAGTLEANPAPMNNSLAGSAHLAPSKQNYSEQLKKLVTSMVRPYAWEDLGGSGKIAYYDIGGALVVNQTADIIREVQDLLESLRRLQDLSVAVEVRLISLTEAFYERVGVDFQMNVKTKNTNSFERSITTGQFRPEPFVNDINVRGVTTGWNPAAGGFTSDLDVPIRPNSYGVSVPPFGQYPGNGIGGLNLGLAFLNDIQVFMFLEAAAGDRRVNVMQAPKLTMFNGQTATVFISDFAFFTTGLQVFNVGGQFVYIPQNTPFPIGNAQPQAQAGGGNAGANSPGVSLTIQPVVSADRRFVRLTLPVQLSALTSATVPLFPVTAFITPVFEGGSQGTPIPFTQFFQQPSFSNISVQSTVVVPDGGTVLVGGLKTLEEGRNEFGPPVLSSVPYLNRLFKNVGIGRETRHLMIMVSARIIIAAEEEAIQTSQGGGQ
jgi:type II secretory pathway component GspD/PulD (secretin)